VASRGSDWSAGCMGGAVSIRNRCDLHIRHCGLQPRAAMRRP
jgi:hypothetical protein